MATHLLIRCGELFLKGKNYPLFERKVVANLQKISAVSKITCLRGRFIVPYFEDHHSIRRVFGLTSYSPAIEVERDMDAIKKAALLLLAGKTGTFKIEPKRSDRSFPLTSPEINIELGRFIEKNTPLRFDGNAYDFLVGVEINHKGAYLFTEVIPCCGGLPTGVEGSVALLVHNEASILAGLLMMKRGVDIFPVSFDQRDISLLQRFSPSPLSLKVLHHITDLEEYARQRKISILTTGETLTERLPEKYPFLRLHPLIAYDSAAISQQLAKFKSV